MKEKNGKPSLAVPGMSMTIPELLNRYKNGMNIPIGNLDYPENEEDEQIQINDLTDLDDYKERVEQINEVSKRISEERTKKAKSTTKEETTPSE